MADLFFLENRNIKRLILSAGVIAGSLCSINANAGWIGSVTIKSVMPRSYGYIAVRTVEPMQNPNSCSNGSYYEIPASGTLTREIYSTLLTAMTVKKSVVLEIEGCSSSGRPILKSVEYFG